jgi:bifunctional non-homologous end joining protein LigD
MSTKDSDTIANRGKSLLEVYRQKRDFQKTVEPSGDRAIRAAAYPRFVIQKHDATRLHYDLRLEVNGLFKSWAVKRGPSLDPTQKRLAVEVEDHPLDYGDFEGTIPKGEYGGGTVMVWDRGYWVPVGTNSAADALENGELKFTLGGDKLKGSWVLVRLAHDRIGNGKRTNWLLIKHRDEWAKATGDDDVLARDLSVASGRTLTQIAAGTGDAPQPFVLAKRALSKANAVWHSRPARAKSSSVDATKSITSREAAKPSRVKADGNRVLGIGLSHPDKVLWPGDPGITKRDLAEYLATVGPWMISHLAGHPCSLVRAPDGIDGQHFFQRHSMAGNHDHISLVTVSGDSKPYLQIDTIEGLVSMAQLAAVEFHPWNNERNEPAVPGRLVFDLDPAPDVAFEAVVEGAKMLRKRLEQVGLVAFCKTTGGKGLHVVTPLSGAAKDGLSWDEAKLFAQAICQKAAQEQPTRYLIKMTKKLRSGRIFLDYFRNDRMATAVAPLSPRARPGATVSMPLTWSQVRSDLDPTRFTVRTVPALLAKSKAWHEYHASGRSLKAAIEALVRT